MINIAFLDRLAATRSETEFARTAAGLAVLQLYDSIKTHGYDPSVHGDALRRIGRDVAAIDAGAKLRTALQSVVQALPFWEKEGTVRIGRRAVHTAILMYGEALGGEGEWRVAECVVSLVGMDAELDGETWIAAEARLMMGRASRMCADWEASGIAYRRAYELGMSAGDMVLALRAQIGEANNLWSRGDFPAAKQRLNSVARRARKSCPSILPRVILAQAGVANAAGEYEHAIHLAFGLLQSLPEDDEMRYKTLVDLAAFLSDYGLPAVASSALRMVERAAPEAGIRRHARLNLMFLAARQGDEVAFDALRSTLADESLTPRQQTQYALFSAQGLRRFGKVDAARAAAERAIQLANQHELFQLVFESEAELREAHAAGENPTEAVPPRYLRFSGPGTGVAASSVDVTATIFNQSDTRGKIPVRIRRVAESLTSMADRFSAAQRELASSYLP
jgi:hypothetical protein